MPLLCCWCCSVPLLPVLAVIGWGIAAALVRDDAGYEEGNDLGYNEGMELGKEDGYDVGYDEGYADGADGAKNDAYYGTLNADGQDQTAGSGDVVYCTASGSCYHHEGCSYCREAG